MPEKPRKAKVSHSLESGWQCACVASNTRGQCRIEFKQRVMEKKGKSRRIT